MTGYKVETVKASKPTKKNPDAPKITGKDALENYLNALKKGVKVVSIMYVGFSYQVVTYAEDT